MSWSEKFSKIAARIKPPAQTQPTPKPQANPQMVLEAGIITSLAIDYLAAKTTPQASASFELTPDDATGWNYAKEQADAARRRAIQCLREDLQNRSKNSRNEFDRVRGNKHESWGYER